MASKKNEVRSLARRAAQSVRSGAVRAARLAGRRARRAGSVVGRKVFSRETFVTVGGTVAGYVATNLIISKLPVPQLQTGWGRLAGMSAIAIGGGMVLRKVAPKFATPFAVGGLTAVALDLWNAFGPQGYTFGNKPPGFSGYIDTPGGLNLYGFGGGMGALGGGGVGMGEYDPALQLTTNN